MAHIEIDRHTFYDVNMIPRILRGVCVGKVADLKLYYSLFWKEIQKIDPLLNIDFKVACDQPKILNTAITITELCGIDSSWIDLDILGALVHSYIDEAGEPQKGLIAQIHFKAINDPKPSTIDSSESITFDQYYIELMATLATTEGSLIAAKATLDHSGITQAEIEGYLAVKAERLQKQQADPKNLGDKIRRGKAKYIDLKTKAEARERAKINA